MNEFRRQLRLVLAHRHGPEASALYRTCFDHASRRVGQLARGRCRGLLEEADQDEVVAEVITQLMETALARFRGETAQELLAFVRTMTDRMAVRRAQRNLRARNTIDRVLAGGEAPWETSAFSAPDAGVADAQSPLDEADRTYVSALLQAGSKAELARTAGVSRAAVSQRIARIEARLAALSTAQQEAHVAWLFHEATRALQSERPTDG